MQCNLVFVSKKSYINCVQQTTEEFCTGAGLLVLDLDLDLVLVLGPLALILVGGVARFHFLPIVTTCAKSGTCTR